MLCLVLNYDIFAGHALPHLASTGLMYNFRSMFHASYIYLCAGEIPRALFALALFPLNTPIWRENFSRSKITYFRVCFDRQDF